MNPPTELTPIECMILARLLVAGEKGATGSDLKKALEPLLGHRWAGAELVERINQAQGALDAAGWVTRTRKGRTERSTLTESGHRRALLALGIAQLPPKTTWDKVKKTYLAAMALGLPSPQADAARSFAADNGFKAALLKAKYELPTSDYPKLDDAISALAWKLMGFEPGPKFDVKTVQAALIQRALGEPRSASSKPDPKKEVARLLAKQVGARQSGKDELRLAVIRDWADQEPVTPTRPAPVSPPPPAPDLNAFAARVTHAARSASSGRYGDNKVFIVHVWRELQSDPAFSALDFEGFKQRLAEANHARLLDLSRADLVEAMDPDDVRLSEVPYQGATFHFIRI